MLTESLVIAGAIVVLVILTIIGLMSRYRRCASDEILVVFGKAGKKTQTNPTTGKKETVVLPSKIIHGGGTFVFPVIQDWRKMSLKPMHFHSFLSIFFRIRMCRAVHSQMLCILLMSRCRAISSCNNSPLQASLHVLLLQSAAPLVDTRKKGTHIQYFY